MNRFIALILLLVLSGGCACRDRYEPALSQWQTNLERLRLTMQKGADTLPDDLGNTKMGLYDRTIQGIKRVRGEGPAVWNQEAGADKMTDGGEK